MTALAAPHRGKRRCIAARRGVRFVADCGVGKACRCLMAGVQSPCAEACTRAAAHVQAYRTGRRPFYGADAIPAVALLARVADWSVAEKSSVSGAWRRPGRGEELPPCSCRKAGLRCVPRVRPRKRQRAVSACRARRRAGSRRAAAASSTSPAQGAAARARKAAL